MGPSLASSEDGTKIHQLRNGVYVSLYTEPISSARALVGRARSETELDRRGRVCATALTGRRTVS